MNSAQFLQLYFKRKKRNNPSYTSRALARDLKISVSFLSEILTNKKRIPTKRLSLFAKVLEIDSPGERRLRQILILEILQESGFSKKDLKIFSEGSYSPADKKALDGLSPWYLPAIMDLSTCEDFDPHPPVLAKRLGLAVAQVDNAIKHLTQLGLIKLTPEGFKKTESKLRVTALETKEKIRNYHKEMIQKSIQCLTENTDAQSFQARLITGITTAANSEKLQEAKEILDTAMHQAAEVLSQDSCTQVYQINVQLFPLVK